MISHRNSTFDRTRVSISPSLDSRMISPDGERGVGLRQVSGDHRRCGFVAVAIASSSSNSSSCFLLVVLLFRELRLHGRDS